MQVDAFNALAEPEARATLGACFGVERWVDELVDARPYGDLAALLAQGRASAENLTDDELAEALRQHPRIGERSESSGDDAAMSHAEQSGVDATDTELSSRLLRGNKAYEDRFGRVFLIRAAGRDSDEILAELERRLGNDDATERRETVAELRHIALLRLEQVVTR